jgi:xanthine dehydrogenase YagS FAD-binding subunit
MKPFDIYNATKISEATSLLAGYKKGEAKIYAGGTDLLGILKGNILPMYPAAIINLKTIPDMDYIKEESGVLKIGALAKLADIANSGVVKDSWRILADAAFSVATPQIRNMATLGGNLCQNVRCWYFRASKSVGRTFLCLRKGGKVCFAVTGDNRHHAILGAAGCYAVFPSDTGVALSALNATIITNKKKTAIGNFFHVLGPSLETDEIVTEIQVPKPAAGTRMTFNKMRQRKAMDFAIVSVASAIALSDGRVADARIILGGVSPMPYRATKVENFIKGKSIGQANADAAVEGLVADAKALSHNSHKIQITKALVARAIMA